MDESLKKIIGLNTVKENIKKFEKYALYTVKARNLGLEMNKSNLHMILQVILVLENNSSKNYG